MQSRLTRVSTTAIVVFISAVQLLAATEGGVQWIDDPDVAAREATRTGKPILMQVTAKWCGYCHKMFRETYADAEIVASANNNFVCLRVDADKHKKLVNEIGVKALPTTVVLTPTMRVAKKVSGYQSVSRLNSILRETRMLARQAPGQTRVASKPVPATPTKKPVSSTRGQQTTSSGAGGFDRGTNPFEQLPPSSQTRTRSAGTTTRNAVRTVSDSRTVPDGFDRMCLVTLFDERRIETGSPDYSSTHRGRKVYFTSSSAKARFDARPNHYWPMLDGHCVVTYLQSNRQAKGNPVHGAVFRQRMWFFRSAEQMETFIANPTEYLPQQRTPQT